MNTITYFKIFVLLFVAFCSYEFFLIDLFRSIRAVLFTKFTLITFLIITLTVTTNSVVYSQKKNTKTLVYKDVEAAKMIPEAQQISLKDGNKMPSNLRFKKDQKIGKNQFIPWLKKSFKTNAAIDFEITKSKVDPQGNEHVWIQQTLAGLPVKNATYIVHLSKNKVNSFNGFAVNVTNTPTDNQSISEDEALQKVLLTQGIVKLKSQDPFWEKDIKEHKNDPKATYAPKGELMYWQNKSGKLIKIYQFDIYAASPDKAFRVLVNAGSGEIENIIPLESNCSPTSVNTIFNGSRNISTELYTADDFRMRDDCDAAIIHIRDWGSADCTSAPFEIENDDNVWNTQDEIFGGTVLWYTKEAYHYWQDDHSRNSYDDANGTVNGYINAVFDGDDAAGCQAYTNNASMSFSGGNMKVGLGSGGTLTNSYATLDIIGHEYAHAVTGSTAGLEYQDESGALNESFSDIFGEALERYTIGNTNWLLGSDRSSGHIRSMSDPKDKGQPDTYDGTNWYTGSNDNGGVHTNSGVQNFWFYLLAEGGSGTNDNGDAYTVAAIGFDKAARICYNNLLFHLGTTSDYADARDASITTVSDIWGDCSPEMIAVMDAWYAVGVGDEFPKATAGVNDATVCVGATINLTAEGGNSYSWSGPGGFTSDQQNPVRNNAQLSHAGSYTVTVTFSNGCTGTASVAVTVNPLPVPVASATPNPVCSGKSVSFNASGGVTYSWSGPSGLSSNSPAFLIGNVQLSNAGLYNVTVTSGDGCSASTSFNLVVNQSPVPSASATPNPVCVESVLNLSSAGGATYAWSGPNGFTSSIQKPAITITSENNEGLYTVTVTSAAGCFETASVNVIVNPLPVGTISVSTTSACVGNSIQFGATGGVSYLWTGPQGFSSTLQNPSRMITAYNQRGQYTVRITNEFGCYVTKSVTIEVYFPPVATANHDKSTACVGSNLALTAGGSGNKSWSGPNGFTSTLANPVIPGVTGLNSGIYTVTVTSPNGCTATASTNVNIVAPPNVTAGASDLTVCEGSSVQLLSTGGITYKWTGPYGYVNSQQNPWVANIPAYMSGVFNVTGTGSTGCKTTASVNINVYHQIVGSANASPNPVSAGQQLQLSSTGGSSYLWSGPNGFYSTEQNPVIYNAGYLNVGMYVVLVYNEGGCENAYFVNVTLKNSNLVTENETDIKSNAGVKTLYPNPSKDYINLGHEFKEPVKYKIIDVNGKVVLSNMVAPGEQIDVRQLSNGFFTIIWSENKDQAEQFINKFIKTE